jgi:hypothetical protein
MFRFRRARYPTKPSPPAKSGVGRQRVGGRSVVDPVAEGDPSNHRNQNRFGTMDQIDAVETKSTPATRFGCGLLIFLAAWTEVPPLRMGRALPVLRVSTGRRKRQAG